MTSSLSTRESGKATPGLERWNSGRLKERCSAQAGRFARRPTSRTPPLRGMGRNGGEPDQTSICAAALEEKDYAVAPASSRQRDCKMTGSHGGIVHGLP